MPGSSTASTSRRWPRAASGRRAVPPSSSATWSARCPASARSTCARRPGARRRCSRARSSRSRSTRRGPHSSRRRPAGWERPAFGSSSPTAAIFPRSSRASTGRSWTRRARVSGCSPRAPISAGGPSPSRSSSSSFSGRRSPACGPAGRSSTPTCTIDREECEDVVDAVVADGGVEIDASLGESWPAFRHRSRPAFLQTLPHVHGTSGFFVARLSRL